MSNILDKYITLMINISLPYKKLKPLALKCNLKNLDLNYFCYDVFHDEQIHIFDITGQSMFFHLKHKILYD